MNRVGQRVADFDTAGLFHFLHRVGRIVRLVPASRVFAVRIGVDAVGGHLVVHVARRDVLRRHRIGRREGDRSVDRERINHRIAVAVDRIIVALNKRHVVQLVVHDHVGQRHVAGVRHDNRVGDCVVHADRARHVGGLFHREGRVDRYQRGGRLGRVRDVRLRRIRRIVRRRGRGVGHLALDDVSRRHRVGVGEGDSVAHAEFRDHNLSVDQRCSLWQVRHRLLVQMVILERDVFQRHVAVVRHRDRVVDLVAQLKRSFVDVDNFLLDIEARVVDRDVHLFARAAIIAHLRSRGVGDRQIGVVERVTVDLNRQRYRSRTERLDVPDRPYHRLHAVDHSMLNRDIFDRRRMARRVDEVHARIQHVGDLHRLRDVQVVGVADRVDDLLFHLDHVEFVLDIFVVRLHRLRRLIIALARVGDGEAVRRFRTLADRDGILLAVNRDHAVLSALLSDRVLVQRAVGVILGQTRDGILPAILAAQRERLILKLLDTLIDDNRDRLIRRNQAAIQRAIAVIPHLVHSDIHRAGERVDDGALVEHTRGLANRSRIATEALDVLAVLRHSLDHRVGVLLAVRIVLVEARIRHRPVVAAFRSRNGQIIRLNRDGFAAYPAVRCAVQRQPACKDVFSRTALLRVSVIDPRLGHSDIHRAGERVDDGAPVEHTRILADRSRIATEALDVLAALRHGLDHRIGVLLAVQVVIRKVRIGDRPFAAAALHRRDARRSVRHERAGFPIIRRAVQRQHALKVGDTGTGLIRIAVNPDLGHVHRRALALVGDGDGAVLIESRSVVVAITYRPAFAGSLGHGHLRALRHDDVLRAIVRQLKRAACNLRAIRVDRIGDRKRLVVRRRTGFIHHDFLNRHGRRILIADRVGEDDLRAAFCGLRRADSQIILGEHGLLGRIRSLFCRGIDVGISVLVVRRESAFSGPRPLIAFAQRNSRDNRLARSAFNAARDLHRESRRRHGHVRRHIPHLGHGERRHDIARVGEGDVCRRLADRDLVRRLVRRPAGLRHLVDGHACANHRQNLAAGCRVGILGGRQGQRDIRAILAIGARHSEFKGRIIRILRPCRIVQVEHLRHGHGAEFVFAVAGLRRVGQGSGGRIVALGILHRYTDSRRLLVRVGEEFCRLVRRVQSVLRERATGDGFNDRVVALSIRHTIEGRRPLAVVVLHKCCGLNLFAIIVQRQSNRRILLQLNAVEIPRLVHDHVHRLERVDHGDLNLTLGVRRRDVLRADRRLVGVCNVFGNRVGERISVQVVRADTRDRRRPVVRFRQNNGIAIGNRPRYRRQSNGHAVRPQAILIILVFPLLLDGYGGCSHRVGQVIAALCIAASRRHAILQIHLNDAVLNLDIRAVHQLVLRQVAEGIRAPICYLSHSILHVRPAVFVAGRMLLQLDSNRRSRFALLQAIPRLRAGDFDRRRVGVRNRPCVAYVFFAVGNHIVDAIHGRGNRAVQFNGGSPIKLAHRVVDWRAARIGRQVCPFDFPAVVLRQLSSAHLCGAIVQRHDDARQAGAILIAVIVPDLLHRHGGRRRRMRVGDDHRGIVRGRDRFVARRRVAFDHALRHLVGDRRAVVIRRNGDRRRPDVRISRRFSPAADRMRIARIRLIRQRHGEFARLRTEAVLIVSVFPRLGDRDLLRRAAVGELELDLVAAGGQVEIRRLGGRLRHPAILDILGHGIRSRIGGNIDAFARERRRLASRQSERAVLIGLRRFARASHDILRARHRLSILRQHEGERLVRRRFALSKRLFHNQTRIDRHGSGLGKGNGSTINVQIRTDIDVMDTDIYKAFKLFHSVDPRTIFARFRVFDISKPEQTGLLNLLLVFLTQASDRIVCRSLINRMRVAIVDVHRIGDSQLRPNRIQRQNTRVEFLVVASVYVEAIGLEDFRIVSLIRLVEPTDKGIIRMSGNVLRNLILLPDGIVRPVNDILCAACFAIRIVRPIIRNAVRHARYNEVIANSAKRRVGDRHALGSPINRHHSRRSGNAIVVPRILFRHGYHRANRDVFDGLMIRSNAGIRARVSKGLVILVPRRRNDNRIFRIIPNLCFQRKHSVLNVRVLLVERLDDRQAAGRDGVRDRDGLLALRNDRSLTRRVADVIARGIRRPLRNGHPRAYREPRKGISVGDISAFARVSKALSVRVPRCHDRAGVLFPVGRIDIIQIKGFFLGRRRILSECLFDGQVADLLVVVEVYRFIVVCPGQRNLFGASLDKRVALDRTIFRQISSFQISTTVAVVIGIEAHIVIAHIPLAIVQLCAIIIFIALDPLLD